MAAPTDTFEFPRTGKKARPSRGRVGVFVGADRSRDGRGDRPFPDFLGCQSFVPERARTRAGASHARVDGSERFEGTRSEGIGRRRARAAVETRASARGDGRFRARPETVSGARDVGVAR